MASSYWARIGLLALLPLIALAVYIDGQRYDPAVLDFSKPPGGELAALLPKQSAGLLTDGDVRVFNKDNLFELVNGHAEFFISAGFKSAIVGGYRREKDNPGLPSYSVDVYDMGAPANAFGVMTEEGSGGEAVDVGFMGLRKDKEMMFIKGAYYVKISAFTDGGEMMELATAISNQMGDIKTAMPQFERLPKPGAVKNGRSFINSDYMGMNFLSGVFEQKYERDGKEFTAFTFTPKDGAEKFVETVKSFCVTSGAEFKQDAEVYEVSDKYEGSWSFVVTGQDIIAARGLDERDAVTAFLREAMSIKKIGSQ